MGAAKQHTVGKKIFDSFFIMIVVTFIIGLIGYKSSARIERATDVIVSEDLPGIESLLQADRDLQQLLVAERTLMLVQKDTELYGELRADYDENLGQAKERWSDFKKLDLSDEQENIIKKFETAWEKWLITSGKVIDAIDSDNNEERNKALTISIGDANTDFETMRTCIDNLTELTVTKAENGSAAARSTYKRSRNSIYIVTGLGVFFGVFFIILNRRGIVLPLKRAITGINEGADQVSMASGQLSEASQSLAAGASQQAASIEETSSALEEISSMIRQSSENSKLAENLMKETKTVADLANDYMEQMSISMKEISTASQETSNIVKTIDEIAFQTNLLALNAAVEAARAGEAGAGFAVVADEVRSLALRAAEAAKNTANLIEATVRRVDSGADLSETTRKEFAKVTESSKKVAELIGEIAAASDEQAVGIGQIAKSVDEMNTVTQQNAANAEESASSSEEMNAQARMMKSMVADLGTMVGTLNGHAVTISRNESELPSYHDDYEDTNLAKNKIEKMDKNQLQRNIIRAEQVIPLDEDDFEDF
jgi:methyl-accepting chemotaxis protein